MRCLWILLMLATLAACGETDPVTPGDTEGTRGPAPSDEPQPLPVRGPAPRGFGILDETLGAEGWARKIKDPRTNITFLLVEPGTFRMGSDREDGQDNEKPAHDVRITKPYYLAETETTVGQWIRYLDATRQPMPGEPGDLRMPQARITFEEIRGFSEYYSYRLPTEAEWEYACRAGTTEDLYGDLHDIGWQDAWSAQPVRLRRPNAWGFFDMIGNLNEWCADAYDAEYYARSLAEDPQNETGSRTTLRGGN